AELPAGLQAAVARRQPGAGARSRAKRVDQAPMDQHRPGMDLLADGLRRAVALLLSGDVEVYGVALLTLKVAAIATTLACVAGMPTGFMLATRAFWGRRAALTVVNTALAFPTVVVGLLLYGLLSRRGQLVRLLLLATC